MIRPKCYLQFKTIVKNYEIQSHKSASNLKTKVFQYINYQLHLYTVVLIKMLFRTLLLPLKQFLIYCIMHCWSSIYYVVADTFVKLLFMIENKLTKTKKTAAVKKSTDPKYNESFHFRLPQKCLNSASILLQITVSGGPQKG